MARLSELLTQRWVSAVVAVLGLLLSGAVIAGVGQASSSTSPAASLPRGSDSQKAVELAERAFDDQGTSAVVLLTRTDGEPFTDAELAVARGAAARLADGIAPVPSEDGTAVLSVVPLQAETSTEVSQAVADLRSAAREGLPAGLQAQVTGEAGVQADLAAVFDGADLRLLMATAAIVAVLLLITYRSPILWVIPLLVVAMADQVAAVVATQVLAVLHLTWAEDTVGILSVLVFGAGTDYALLLISRYRDELTRHVDRRAAMAVALRRTVEPVLASAATVFVGLLTLSLSLFGSTAGLGVACAVGVLVAAFFALVVLPATLVCFGRWVFWPRVPRTGGEGLAESRSLWRRVGERVARRPAVVVAASVAVVALLSLPLTQLRLGLDDADQFLVKPEAIAAAERLAQSYPAGSASPVRVVTAAPADEVSRAVGETSGIASVRTVASGEGVTELNAVLEASPDSERARDTVLALRAGLAGTPSHVAGSTAEAIDVDAATARDRTLIFPLVLALVLAALAVLLRSVVAPVILVLTVVSTYTASLGLSWLVFTRLLGFEALDVQAPLYAFVFLVALGVDYNIFLVTRAAEEAPLHGARQGMLRALGATGGVITSAGVLLAAVFAVLGVLPLVVLAQIGVIICIGVLLDTLVVRTVMVPAIAFVLGDRFWWPRQPTRPAVEATTRPVP